jgi:hypothetical protein
VTSGTVTQDRPVTRCQNSCHPSPLPGDSADTDDIDPSMELVELPPLKPQIDRSAPHSDREQLSPRNHAVLSLRHRGHLPVKKSSVQLTLYARANCTFADHAADAEGAGRACGAQIVPIRWRLAHEKRPQPAVAASGFDPFM